jgi:pimeloyl-ACP methyl ester carboxylesterase
VLRPTLRGTRGQAPKAGAIAGAPDHNPAEHGVWVGRPLLSQWATDAVASLWALDNWEDKEPITLVGIGPAALVALAAVPHAPERLAAVVLIDPPVSLVTEQPYAAGTPMGILAPGILKVGDVSHLTALAAPHRLVVAGGFSPQGRRLNQRELDEAFGFTARVYRAVKAADKITVAAQPDWAKLGL